MCERGIDEPEGEPQMSDAQDRIDMKILQRRYDALIARYGHLLGVNAEMAETIATLKDREKEPILGEVEMLKALLYQAKQELVEKDQLIAHMNHGRIRMDKKIRECRKILDEGLTE